MGLAIRVEDRTGDTGAAQRARQRSDPPHVLLTTPESLALMLSYPEAPAIFGRVSRVILDEIHALAESKRGDQLMLGLARLQSLAPDLRRIGLSATVEDPPALAAFLGGGARILEADPGPEPDISILDTGAPPPWAGQTARHAAPAVMDLIRAATTTLVFINTRAQAELFFQALWAENAESLPIGLHHGSLSREARARVEAAMVAGAIRAIVCTGSLDLGIDWGSVDLVVQVGAPKNVKRLVQRIGRANHRYNAPSRAVLVPANRFEVIECRAALDAVRARDLDGEPRGPGPLDVLCQHMLLTACAGPFEAEALFAEVRSAGPYRDLARADFDACLDYCATGGYALRAYDRWRRLVERDGLWSLRDPRRARMIRMNIGTIVDTETLAVRLRGRFGSALGEVEEDFAASLVPGDTFLIGGETVRYEGLREMVVEVSRAPSRSPKIAVFMGTKLATSTRLSQRVVELLADPAAWAGLPSYMRGWLELQHRVSRLPEPGRLLAETFARGEREHLCLYGFAGRNAHQTLGLLVTRRMEAAGLDPLGFVATDYALADLGPHARHRPRRPAHARGPARRARRLARRERGDEAHIPQRRHHRRADRAQPAGRAQDRPAGDLFHRHPLRHPAPPRPRPSLAAHHALRGRPRPRRFRPHRGNARPRLGAHRRRARAACHSARRAAPARGRPRADQGPRRSPPRRFRRRGVAGGSGPRVMTRRDPAMARRRPARSPVACRTPERRLPPRRHSGKLRDRKGQPGEIGDWRSCGIVLQFRPRPYREPFRGCRKGPACSRMTKRKSRADGQSAPSGNPPGQGHPDRPAPEPRHPPSSPAGRRPE